MSAIQNLMITVVGGVAVMVIWQAIQKRAASKAAGLNSGGVKGGNTAYGDQFKPSFLGVSTEEHPAGNGGLGEVVDLLDTSSRTYYI